MIKQVLFEEEKQETSVQNVVQDLVWVGVGHAHNLFSKTICYELFTPP